MAGLDEDIATGEPSPLREWLAEGVHRPGPQFSTTELLAREVGEPILVDPYIGYLKRKLSCGSEPTSTWRDSTRTSPPASSHRCASGCASAYIATAPSSPPPNCWRGRSESRFWSTPTSATSSASSATSMASICWASEGV